MSTNMKFYPIRYTWTTRGKVHHGSSVERGMTLADAEARFARDNPHVEIVRPMPRPIPAAFAAETAVPVPVNHSTL